MLKLVAGGLAGFVAGSLVATAAGYLLALFLWDRQGAFAGEAIGRTQAIVRLCAFATPDRPPEMPDYDLYTRGQRLSLFRRGEGVLLYCE